MELISLSDFVSGLHDIYPTIAKDAIKWTKTQIYTRFIIQPLNLGMFVPAKEVGGKWEVLEEPIESTFDNKQKYLMDLHLYNKYKENVLFEGFWYNKETEHDFENVTSEDAIIQFEECKPLFTYHKTIEDLIGTVKLTPNGIKQAGL